MLIYFNGQLYAVVVRACAVSDKKTAKIQSFCSVSAVLFLLCINNVCEMLLVCFNVRRVVLLWFNRDLILAHIQLFRAGCTKTSRQWDNVEVNGSMAWWW